MRGERERRKKEKGRGGGWGGGRERGQHMLTDFIRLRIPLMKHNMHV